MGLREEIENAINNCCGENVSNTPDFLLAEYVMSCLDAFDVTVKKRDAWYSVHLEPCNSHFTDDRKAFYKEEI